MKSHVISIVLLSALSAVAACTPISTPSSQSLSQAATQTPAPRTPQITLTKTRVNHPDTFFLNGSGFTPKGNVNSHLKRPDGSEFNVLIMLTNDKGEFVNEMESLLLQNGTHEVWVFDETTGAKSNVAKFDVVRE